MRLFLGTLFALLACSAGEKDDTSTATTESDADTDADADADADADTDTDTDTDTDCTATVSGTMVGYDGATPAGTEIQFCELTCFTTDTDATGAWAFTQMCPGSYKLDGVGEFVEDHDYGRIRAHVDLGADDVAVDEALFLPRVLGPATVTSAGAPMTWGEVTLGLDLDNLTVPFGYEADQIWVGTVDAPDVPGFWGVAATYAITFVPLATQVAAPFTLSANAGLAAGDYDVYSVDDHGELEGPVGSATVGGDGEIPNTTVSPTILSWLLFVPK